jgi:lipoic acid synthetase
VTTGKPSAVDHDEPLRVAQAVQAMRLKHAVVTSVNRDELADGGAAVFAETIRQIRRLTPTCTVEVLIPDFEGDQAALRTVADARPDILNHNIETVERLFPTIRPQGKYRRSIELLGRARQVGMTTKSGLIVGMGETEDEIRQVMRDLRSVGCDILTVGQYLQPTRNHLPVSRFYRPDEFVAFKTEALALGFSHAESAPLARSSYHAEQQMLR